MTEQCKKDIEEYVSSKGWINNKIFYEDKFIRNYFYRSKKGIKNNFLEQWGNGIEKMDKYLLEFIGHILRKHNIIEIEIKDSPYDNDNFDKKICIYSSKDWKFNNILKN